MTTTFLGFFMNRSNREEFVAPVVAQDVAAARDELAKAYPESRFALLTVYSRPELEHVLAGVDRWPGLPSKVQEPVRADLTKVTAHTGGLPPLPGQVQATVEAMETIDSAKMPGWMKSFISQQQTPQAKPAPNTAAKVPAFLNQPVQKAPRANATASLQPIEQAMSQPKTSLPQQSLIERLKAARGESVAVPSTAKMIRREPVEVPAAATIARKPQGGSVIDILKTMRK